MIFGPLSGVAVPLASAEISAAGSAVFQMATSSSVPLKNSPPAVRPMAKFSLSDPLTPGVSEVSNAPFR